MMSSTSVESNYPYYCRACGELHRNCTCWEMFDDSPEKEHYDKFVPSIAPKKSIWVSTKIIRKTPTSISGMKGIALMKRIGKR